jgi:hypothetical protein
MNKDFFEIFFGESGEYYLGKLDQNEQGKRINFNLPAFFFGIFWFLYRRMYLQAFIILAFIYIYSIIEQFLWGNYLYNSDFATGIYLIDSLLFASFTGFFGNWIYINHAKRKIRKLLTKFESDELLLKKNLKKAGGTSHVWVLLGLCLIIVIYILNTMK